MTLLEIVNQVLIRLREDQVTAFTDSEVATLVAEFAKDTVVEVQKIHNWSGLLTTIPVSTVADDYDYTLTGAGKNFRVVSVWHDTDKFYMRRDSYTNITRKLRYDDVSKESPYYYAFHGFDSSNDPNVYLWPVPNGVYSLKFDLIVPQLRSSLVAATEIVGPDMAYVYMTLSKAIEERGEDIGISATSAMAKGESFLNDDIAIDKPMGYDDMEFYVE